MLDRSGMMVHYHAYEQAPCRHHQQPFLDDMWQRYRAMFEMTFPKIIAYPLRRPHTDDMMQMLVDVGVEPPDKQPFDLRREFIFTWRM